MQYEVELAPRVTTRPTPGRDCCWRGRREGDDGPVLQGAQLADLVLEARGQPRAKSRPGEVAIGREPI